MVAEICDLFLEVNLKKVQGFRSYVRLELSERNETCYENKLSY